MPCWSSSTAERERTWTSAVGYARVASQITGAATAPAPATSSGTTTGRFVRRVSQKMSVVTP